MAKHSIIISSYNRPKLIRQCIDSIFAQTSSDWEAVIADDGSNQETLDSIKNVCRGDSRFRILECKEPYPGNDRGTVLHRYGERINEALEFCSGEIQHYIADDDLYHPERLKIFDSLFADPLVMAGYGRMLYINEEGKPYGEERFPPGPRRRVRWIIDHDQVAHRRSVFEKVPRWPILQNSYALDACFFVEIAKHWDFVPIDGIVAYKRVHSFNMTNTRSFSTAKRES